jgi:hypothetical protein
LTERKGLVLGPKVMEMQGARASVVTTELAAAADLLNQNELLASPLL